jgi:hypothetical protein
VPAHALRRKVAAAFPKGRVARRVLFCTFIRAFYPDESDTAMFSLAGIEKVAYLTAGCWEAKGAARSLCPQQFTDR